MASGVPTPGTSVSTGLWVDGTEVQLGHLKALFKICLTSLGFLLINTTMTLKVLANAFAFQLFLMIFGSGLQFRVSSLGIHC